MNKKTNWTILALALCASPSYALKKNKNKIAELKQIVDIASTAEDDLGDLKDLRARLEQAETSYNAAKSNYSNMKTQIDNFGDRIAIEEKRARDAQQSKDAIEVDIQSVKDELETVNGKIAELEG